MQTSTSTPNPTSSHVATDRRQHARFVVDPMYSAVSVAPAPSKRKASAPSVEGHVYDVSMGGMRFELDEPMRKGSRVVVEISLPGCVTPIQAEGRIVRVFDQLDDPGPRRMAVEFETFAAGARDILERYLGQKWLRPAPGQPFVEESEQTCEAMIETSSSCRRGSKSRTSVSAA